MIPSDASGQPLVVYVNVSILALPAIDTIGLKYTADFYLSIRLEEPIFDFLPFKLYFDLVFRWYDLRIRFRDLNEVTSLNSLSEHDRATIWSPQLAFINALGKDYLNFSWLK